MLLVGGFEHGDVSGGVASSPRSARCWQSGFCSNLGCGVAHDGVLALHVLVFLNARCESLVMPTPTAGDLLVRYERETDRYFIIDAATRVLLEGPFVRLDFAVGIANSMAYNRDRTVWRESIDQNGAVREPPTLITPRPTRAGLPEHVETTDESKQ